MNELAQWELQISELVRSKGGNASAAEFQRALNIIFHDEESKVYDQVHVDMWLSLPPVFDRALDGISGEIFVDIGCGTGLASVFAAERLRVKQHWFVDSSEKMLEICRNRGWPSAHYVPELADVPDTIADAAIACSVLHHIPDLTGFCEHVSRIVKPGGHFIHIHDSQPSPRLRPWTRTFLERAISGAKRRLNRILSNRHKYIEEVNRRLIADGWIKTPLSDVEIWSITDLRVGGQPYTAVEGVSIDHLNLPDFDLVRHFTYGFFGVFPSQLSPRLQREERELFSAHDPSGLFHAGVWRKRTGD